LKILFDSSVLIASFIELHPQHNPALEYFRKAKDKEFEFIVSAHSILEVYSVLTSAPFNPRITPITAKRLIENNIKKNAKVISLSDKDYFRILKKVSEYNLSGGIVYDAIIAECAEKSNSDLILTLNIRDFIRLNISNSIKIISV